MLPISLNFAQVTQHYCRDRDGNMDTNCFCRLDKLQICQIYSKTENNLTKCWLTLENLNISSVMQDFKLVIPKNWENPCSQLNFQWKNMDIQNFGGLVTELPKQMLPLTKQGNIVFNTLPKLNSDDFQTLVENIEVNKSVILTLEVINSFENDSMKSLKFDNFAHKLDHFRIQKPGAVLDIGSPFIVSKEQSLDIAGGTYTPACLNILIPTGRQRFSLTWATKQMFPQIFKEIDPTKKLELKVYFSGDGEIVYKEQLAYAGVISFLHISMSVNRIEYGALGTTIEKLPSCVVSRFDQDEDDLDDQEKFDFINGDCHKLEKRTCEICYMHQKGLHRENDFLEESCRTRTKILGKQLQKCYWREPQPIPAELAQYNINQSSVDPSVPLCPPSLVPVEIQNIPCGSSPTIKPPTISTTVKPKTTTTTTTIKPLTKTSTEASKTTTTKPGITTTGNPAKSTSKRSSTTTITEKPRTKTTTESAEPTTNKTTTTTKTPITTTTTKKPYTATTPLKSSTTTSKVYATTTTTTTSKTTTTSPTTTTQATPVPCIKEFETKGTPNCWCVNNIAQYCVIESSVISAITNCKLDIEFLVIEAFSDNFILEPRQQECDNFEVKLVSLPVKYLGGFGAKLSRHWLKLKKYGKITLNNIWKLNSSDLENNLRMMVKNKYQPVFEVEINSSFLQNSSNLHISKFAEKFDKTMLINLYNNFITENPFVMNNNSGLLVENSLAAQNFINIIVTNDQTSNEVFLDWNNKQFFPQLYKEIDAAKNFFINLTGSVVYLQKEILYNIGTIETLKVGKDVQRIEFGTIATPKKVLVNNFIDPDTNQKYFLKSYDRDNFLRSKCSEISLQFVCEICYMHQYGLHKSKNKIPTLCQAKIVPEIPLKKCYWRDAQPIPESLCHYNVDQSRLNNEASSGVRTCAAIPEDIQDFLNTLPKQRGNCVNPTTLTTKPGVTTKSPKNPTSVNPNPGTTTATITPSPTGCKPINPNANSSVYICTCNNSILTSCDLQVETKKSSNETRCRLEIVNMDIKNISNNFTIKTNNKQLENCSHISLVIDSSSVENFGNLAQVAKSSLLRSETGFLTFKNLPGVTAYDLEKLIEQLTEKTEDITCQLGKNLNAKLNLNIDTVFRNYIQEDYFDIVSFYNRFSSVFVNNLFKPVTFKNPLILDKTSSMHFDNSLFKNKLNFVALSGNQSKIYWENYDFYPQFYRVEDRSKNSNKSVGEIFINGSSSYILKEVFAYSGEVDTIGLNHHVQRIEYGALANTKTLRANCFKNLSSHGAQKVCFDQSRNDKKNFLNGSCTKMSDKFLCEICFMHQFGLHKTVNNVTQLCNGTSEYRLMTRECYWRPLQPVPIALRDYQIDNSFIDKSVTECEYIFKDVQQFLDASYQIYNPEVYVQ